MSGVKYMFIDHPSLDETAQKYMLVRVDCARVVESWRASLFAHEWLLPDGTLKHPQDLSIAEQKKRAGVMADLAAGRTPKRPLLGIGLFENVEFCMGRAEFLTCYDMGAQSLEVHIRKDQENDFKTYLYAIP